MDIIATYKVLYGDDDSVDSPFYPRSHLNQNHKNKSTAIACMFGFNK